MTPSTKTAVHAALLRLRESRDADRESRIRAGQELVGAALRVHRGRLPRRVIRRLIAEIRSALGHEDAESSQSADGVGQVGAERERDPSAECRCRGTVRWRLSGRHPWTCQACHPCPHAAGDVEWASTAVPVDRKHRELVPEWAWPHGAECGEHDTESLARAFHGLQSITRATSDRTAFVALRDVIKALLVVHGGDIPMCVARDLTTTMAGCTGWSERLAATHVRARIPRCVELPIPTADEPEVAS